MLDKMNYRAMYVLPNVIGLVQLIKSRSNRRYHQQSKNPPPNLIVTAIPSRNKMIKNSIFFPSPRLCVCPPRDEVYQEPINHPPELEELMAIWFCNGKMG